jgi:uncharacterized membrane protein
MTTSFLFGFTFWILLFAVVLIATGIVYRLYPAYKLPWHMHYKLKEALRSEGTWHEAHAFAANRFILAGILLALIGLASLLFPNQRLFTLPMALVLFVTSGIILKRLTINRLNSMFDEQGNRRQAV